MEKTILLHYIGDEQSCDLYEVVEDIQMKYDLKKISTQRKEKKINWSNVNKKLVSMLKSSCCSDEEIKLIQDEFIYPPDYEYLHEEFIGDDIKLELQLASKNIIFYGGMELIRRDKKIPVVGAIITIESDTESSLIAKDIINDLLSFADRGENDYFHIWAKDGPRQVSIKEL